MKNILYLLILSCCPYEQSVYSQIVTGSELYAKAATILSMDSLVLTPSEDTDLGNDYSLAVMYKAVTGKTKASIKKTYYFDKPLNFKGQIGIIYDPLQLNGNSESLLELANSGTDENSLVTLSGSTRDLGMHYVSNTTSNLDLRILTLTDEDGALPVTLVSFEAQKVENSVKLTWKTSVETNSDFFEVQRSGNAKDWQPLVQMKSAGNSAHQANYDCVDSNPAVGGNYYRLKMVDGDGSFAFSQIRKVWYDGKGLTIFPNPAIDRLEMRVKDWSKVTKFRILTISGEVMQERSTTADPKETYIPLTVFKPGSYILQVMYRDGASEDVRFVKY